VAGKRGFFRTAWRYAIGAAGVLFATVAYCWITLPDVRPLKTQTPTSTAFMRMRSAEAIRAGKSPAYVHRFVRYNRISPTLVRAVLLAEDAGFFGHGGVDWEELKISMQLNYERGEFSRGASTITQQLAKNLWLSPSRNPLRKAKEAMLTWQLERALSKRRILEIYLNVVEFGPGVYGAEAASRRYFGKPAAELTEEEAALLAAGLPRPSIWHPGVGSRAYRRYVDDILRRMERIALPVKQLE
jgi:monofunctional biosynthetic peptidoglycan transglycosylase